MPQKMSVIITVICCVILALGNVSPDTGTAYAASQASISGIVRDAATGIGIAGVRVTAKPVTSYNLCDTTGISATTDLDGFYTISGVDSGPYQVRFEVISTLSTNSTVAVPSYIPQWYGGVSDDKAATVLRIKAPQATKGIDARLERGGSISGTVSDASGPLGSVQITVMDSKGQKRITSTNFDGTYILAGLASGSYILSFATQNSPFFPTTQYIPVTLPSPVPVTAPGNTPNVDLVFTQPGGSITGTLAGTGPSDMVAVSAQLRGSSTPAASTMVFMGSTTFEIGGLVSGTYDLAINSMGSQSAFLPVIKNGIVVTAPNATNIGTTSLTVGGSIQGTVKTVSGALPLQNAYVIAYQGAATVGFGFTLADGTYMINGLPSGSYTVQFSYCQGGLTEQWYNGKSGQSTANTVAVTLPQTVSAINGTLDLARLRFAPVALPQNVQVVVNSARSISLDAQEYNGSHLVYSVVSQPAHGTVSGLPPNVVYTPATGYSGVDTFTFKVNDGTTDSNIAAVSLSVAAASRQKKGDVNGDGDVNVLDALLTLQYIVNLVPHTTEILQAADVAPLDPLNLTPKGNGTVDIADALMILKRVLNLDLWAPTGGGTALSMVNPMNGAQRVPVATAVQAAASKMLQSDTVNITTVRLLEIGPYGSFTMGGSVIYDPSQQTVFFAQPGLSPARTYKLSFSGIRDLGGAPLSDATFSFQTPKNSLKMHVQMNPGGTAQKYSECVINSSGVVTRCVDYIGAGADNNWFTTDDSILTVTSYDYRGDGKPAHVLIAVGPGIDAAWLTGDDVVASYTGYNYDSTGRLTTLVNYNDPGLDKTRFTADDVINDYTAYSYDTSSRLTRFVKYSDPGADGIWFTADDIVAAYRDYRYDPLGRASSYASYGAPGFDAAWFTGDDTLLSFEKYMRDDSGFVRFAVDFSSFDFSEQPGTDLLERGSLKGYWQYGFDGNGRLIRSDYNGNPGADGVWGTDDDSIYTYCSYLYDSSGNKTRKNCYGGPGNDTQWFTADDFLKTTDDYDTIW